MSSAGKPSAANTTRTRVACKNCNERRVRCHRTSSDESCSNCRLRNVECQLIDSKRGKYKRASSRLQQNKKTGQTGQALETEVSPSQGLSANSATPSEDRGPIRYASPSLPDLVIEQDAGDGHRVVYMGDSNNMKYLIHEVGDPFKSLGRRRLWGDYLQQGATARLTPATYATLSALRTADEEHLRNIGAFTLHESHLREELVEVFFDRVYPFFPIFDKTDFQTLHHENRMSPLLLNAVYCVASIHCSEDLIKRLGYDSRFLACTTFYQRAKALHEKDYEKDAIASIQACILLMNWWQEPMDQKDRWFWLGVATHMAQGLGMHRAKSYQILSERRQKLWRRIWWVLFMNDMHHAAVFGRPPHIHSQYSDVPILNVHDMQSTDAADSAMEEAEMFTIQSCRLTVLLDQCLQHKYSAGASRPLESQSWLALKNFSATLPNTFHRSNGIISPIKGFYPAVLELIHLDYLIVVERMLSTDPAAGDSNPLESYFNSAGTICRILEDLSASPSDLVSRLPFASFPAIYCSIGIHIMYLRRDSDSGRLVAEHRARFGMAVSDQLQERWPFAVWTHYLLDRMLKNAGSTLPYLKAPDTQGEKRHSSATDSHGAPLQTTLGTSDYTSFPGTIRESGDMGSGPLPESIAHSRVEQLGLTAGSTATFSPLAFMFPWNSLMDDGMEIDEWLL